MSAWAKTLDSFTIRFLARNTRSALPVLATDKEGTQNAEACQQAKELTHSDVSRSPLMKLVIELVGCSSRLSNLCWRGDCFMDLSDKFMSSVWNIQKKHKKIYPYVYCFFCGGQVITACGSQHNLGTHEPGIDLIAY